MIPTIDVIEKAASRIAPYAVRTPLLAAHDLSQRLAASVFIKPEMLQRTGSFKFRGAYNKISQLSMEDRRKGVVAFSSGNHAQGVAAAAQILGIAATIVMPQDAPWLKIDNTRDYGAKVVLYDRHNEDREAIAHKIQMETGAILVRPFDDIDIITGQATAGLEIAHDLLARQMQPDIVLVPVSGGGLIAGCASALKHFFPAVEIYALEPEGHDDTTRSLAEGKRVKNQPMDIELLCDALGSPTPGEVTFPINRQLLNGGIAVSNDEVLAAMAYSLRHLKLVAEPGGAVGIAALLAGKIDTKGKTIVVVASGGNCDAATLARALEKF